MKPEPTKENSIYVIGEPRPKGSHSAIIVGKGTPRARAQVIPAFDKGGRLRKWEAAVNAQAGQVFRPIANPERVAVWLSFNMADGTALRLDLDKLCRATLDGLNGVAYDDDKQVGQLTASKFKAPSGTPTGCWIMVAEMPLDALNQGAHI